MTFNRCFAIFHQILISGEALNNPTNEPKVREMGKSEKHNLIC